MKFHEVNLKNKNNIDIRLWCWCFFVTTVSDGRVWWCLTVCRNMATSAAKWNGSRDQCCMFFTGVVLDWMERFCLRWASRSSRTKTWNPRFCPSGLFFTFHLSKGLFLYTIVWSGLAREISNVKVHSNGICKNTGI